MPSLIQSSKTGLVENNALVQPLRDLIALLWLQEWFADIVALLVEESLLYQGKRSIFLHWCHGRNIASYVNIVQQIAESFLYLPQELKLSVPGKRAIDMPLIMSPSWLARTVLLTGSSAGYLLVLRNHAFPERSSFQSGTGLGSKKPHSSTIWTLGTILG